MRVRLHKPRQPLWNLALLLFVVGLVGMVVPLPVLSGFAIYCLLFSAAILLLGTSVL